MTAKALYERNRPNRLDDLVGKAQKSGKALLSMALPRRHLAAMIFGPSGVGKSTLASILGAELAGSPMDVHTYNLGSMRGVDFVRDLESNILLATWGSGWRVYVFEEAHNLTPQAQEAMLRLTEHYPLNRALIFTSTDRDAFTPAFRSRLLQVNLVPLSKEDLSAMLRKAAKSEGIKLSASSLSAIIDASQGNARAALNALEWFAASGELPEKPAVLESVASVGSLAAVKAWETRRRNFKVAG